MEIRSKIEIIKNHLELVAFLVSKQGSEIEAHKKIVECLVIIGNLLKELPIPWPTPPVPSSLVIVYYPDGEESFKKELLKTKKAYVLLYKTNGKIESYIWKADRFESSSSVNSNLRSGYLRKWKEKNIFKAEVSTDINDLPNFSLNA